MLKRFWPGPKLSRILSLRKPGRIAGDDFAWVRVGVQNQPVAGTQIRRMVLFRWAKEGSIVKGWE